MPSKRCSSTRNGGNSGGDDNTETRAVDATVALDEVRRAPNSFAFTHVVSH
jgi:hypothetical protein